jgi:hypothetical protein
VIVDAHPFFLVKDTKKSLRGENCSKMQIDKRTNRNKKIINKWQVKRENEQTYKRRIQRQTDIH